MLKNLTSSQLLLIAIAGVFLLLAAFSMILLQNPSAPLFFFPATGTATLPPSTPTGMEQPSATTLPTRQTSYTPFATRLTPPGSAAPATVSPLPGTTAPNPSQALTPGTPLVSPQPGRSATPTATRSPSSTTLPTTPSSTPSPAVTSTLAPGEVAVTGRILKNETPVANVIVEFADDVAPRRASTSLNGAYWFITLAPGSVFRLTFYQADNPQLTPTADFTSLAWLDGNLPINTNPIPLPDLELSLDLNGTPFELDTPMDGASFSASVISSSNPIQFIWTLHNTGGSYHIELGLAGNSQPVWISRQIASTSYMWEGTLDDGTHIGPGTYWWRVAATKAQGNYIQVIFTQPLDIIFTP